ncbi:GNAT family N-acetyltransferase [Saccharobesus litoralis]|uniref:GNAT family N-acetyltransferase n=1 Tax=Saccharobesus litoralis TaxID=2172099 RepID=A0A2S0VMK5_9ALTE|nr:GNAT family protein [Saccharobesus litoralis]AWB65451.1 GNAT family N-acetyltransferase [Saccharobesus litoralis]
MHFETQILSGQTIRLEPLSRDHYQGILQVINDGELWKLFVTLVPHPDHLDVFFDDAQQAVTEGHALPFAIVDQASNQVVGSTRLMKADWLHKRVEIGFTFVAQSFQKTAVNTEAKYLLLQHVFERLEFNRVELLTDYFNRASRNAIERLGAKQEGILRSHMVMPNGRVRDSVLYSIIQHEWPGVRQNLLDKLAMR